MTLGFMVCFFMSGVTLACFREVGTTPELREELMVAVRNGRMSGAMVWRSGEGNGSSWHVVGRFDVTSVRVSASVMGEKDDRENEEVLDSAFGMGGGWEK